MHKNIWNSQAFTNIQISIPAKKMEFTRIYKYPISIPVFQGVGEQLSLYSCISVFLYFCISVFLYLQIPEFQGVGEQLSLASPWKKQRDDNR